MLLQLLLLGWLVALCALLTTVAVERARAARKEAKTKKK